MWVPIIIIRRYHDFLSLEWETLILAKWCIYIETGCYQHGIELSWRKQNFQLHPCNGYLNKFESQSHWPKYSLFVTGANARVTCVMNYINRVRTLTVYSAWNCQYCWKNIFVTARPRPIAWMYLSKFHFVKANLANVGFWVKPGMCSSIYIISIVIYWNLDKIYMSCKVRNF